MCITGCKKEEIEPIEIDGVSMTIKEGSLTNKSATVLIKDTNGKGTYVYGSSFEIQKNKNGKWINLKTNSNNCAFNQMAYYVDESGLLEFDQNWECMYGELEKGKYRIIKSTFLSEDTPITKDDHKYFAVEFSID